jgi:tetraacyldisaccharide 4'-kinase
MMLPAGPMREPKSRLKEADYVVTNGAHLPDAAPMQVLGSQLYNLHDESDIQALKDWRGQKVHAVAAIGNPERFFELLRKKGLQVIEHRFEDHHDFQRKDIVFGDGVPVLMTEKDAVKCKKFISELAPAQYWYVPVEAHLPKDFVAQLDQHIESLFNGQKAA